MARLIDTSKMKRIQEAATDLIVERGNGQASISAIAKKAGVAEGYLYRFHSSKDALVNHLLFSKIGFLIENIKVLMDTHSSVKKVMEILIKEFFTMGIERPTDVKFLYVLMHDYNFQVDVEQRKIIKQIILQLLEKGKESGEISDLVHEEEVFNMVITYPIVFINLRLKNFFGNSTWNTEDQSRIVEFCTKALNIKKDEA